MGERNLKRYFPQAPYYFFCLLWCLMLVKLASRAADQVFVSVYDAIVMYAGWRGPQCIFAKIHSIMMVCESLQTNLHLPCKLQMTRAIARRVLMPLEIPDQHTLFLGNQEITTCLLDCLAGALAIDFISTASNQSGNTHFPLATSCWQMVANPSLCLCDWGLSALSNSS